ncbi:hypothetical protein ASD8599_02526 [Ascidiaceihabitans donghaensis]|uniref:DUF3422 domain-containing protein n=1 Tax=Ascidiaceihabitans donghaensis TaxID=1510460 RepID=A0A2R8BFN7_9RHOB|nr:DUF3422 domain-containing protein [Ascidiaceihabitans donghaensis]SPH21775.1 hypothetical protein ASD8599_02526 [Ascidiaceihabitans donghaensis]
MPPIDDHPMRYKLANELHARPFPSMSAPCTAAYIAIKQSGKSATRDRTLDLDHLIALLDRHGAPHPQPGATHYYGQIGRHWLKWEQHTEFVTYTVFSEGVGDRAFDPCAFDPFPADWLAVAPGVTMTSALLRIEVEDTESKIVQRLQDWFVPESLAVSSVLDGAAVVAGDFRIDTSGHQRFAVFVAPDTGARRIGRIVQRLCEVETYKTMSMLGFARSRELGPDLNRLDTQLTSLVGNMRDADAEAEKTLRELLTVSAELETLSAESAFRFGATGAYEAIVDQRINALREERYLGRQSFGEFMMRRYEPAMRTVKSAERRLEAMTSRSIRVSNLLRTRVDVERSAQNQALLESMDKRSDLQLRLQRTVEGLSVVAISYYAVSLAAYVLYPVTELTGISKGMLTALVALPVVGLVWYMVRRIRSSVEGK